MYKELRSISEATLWDYLKRQTDAVLAEMESIPDTSERHNLFIKKDFKKIKCLLIRIGKEFFRIFLFKAIKTAIDKELKNNYNTQLDEGKVHTIINQVIADFQFYFWPGYTTLTGRRIFIEGACKDKENKHYYFSGVGNIKIKNPDITALIRYFKTEANNPDFSAAPPENFFIRDIPSTLAFDSVMNQQYLNHDAKTQDKKKFITGSTHQWKTSQRGYKEGLAARMPLQTDGSEFRILEVTVADQDRASICDGENSISIGIPNDHAYNSGAVIAARLSADNIPIRFEPEHKHQYNPWPRVVPTNEDAHLIDDWELYKLQVDAASFWIGETLNFVSNRQDQYFQIRNAFKQSKWSYLSDRIHAFSHRIKQLESQPPFTELYYNHWYTLFLDSYSDSSDLGSAMLLTNHSYDAEFLMKCSHWLRWIYNELRLIEAKAAEELKGETIGKQIQLEEDFGKIAHNTKLQFPYLRERIRSITTDNLSIIRDTVIDELSHMENVMKAGYYLNNLDEFEQVYTKRKIDLSEIINKIIEQIKYDLLNNEGKLIKLPSNTKYINALCNAINDNTYPLFQLSLKCRTSQPLIIGHTGIVQVIIKDIISNATKWSTSQLRPGKPKPVVRIKLTETARSIIFECSNSRLITKDAIEVFETGHIPPGSPITNCFGLMLCHRYCTSFGIGKEIIISKKGTTKFIIKFNKWTN